MSNKQSPSNTSELVLHGNVVRQTVNNVPDRLNGGYDNETTEKESDLWIPACGIADADEALKRLFVSDIPFYCKGVPTSDDETPAITRPFVIFATGERWAMAKKLHPPRDKNKTLILPAISIRRTTFEQTPEDITGRGMNQTTGTITVKRKLSKEFDRNHQNIINKLGIENMTNVPTANHTNTGSLRNDVRVSDGALLEPHVEGNSNVWEVYQIPQPQFYTTSYEVIFWCQYTSQMNSLIETFVSSYLPQTRGFRLQSPKGYWFQAYVDNTKQSGDNFDDFKESERVIRYTFTMKIKGYILPGHQGTDRVPVRRWISSPTMVFDMKEVGSSTEFHPSRKELSRDGITSRGLDKTGHTGTAAGSVGEFNLTDINDTLSHEDTERTAESVKHRISTGNRYVTVVDTNDSHGETVYRARSAKDLEQFLRR